MAEKIDIEASKNEDHNKLKVSDLNKRLHKIHLGGGEKRIADHKAKGKIALFCNSVRLRLLMMTVVSLGCTCSRAQGTQDYLIIKYLKRDSARTREIGGQYFSTSEESTKAYNRFGNTVQLSQSDTIEVAGIYVGEYDGQSGEWGKFTMRWHRGEIKYFSSYDDHYLVPMLHLKSVQGVVIKNDKQARSKRLLRWRLTAIKIGLGTLSFIALVVLISGYVRRCVKCRKWFSRKITHTEDLGAFTYTYTTTERRSVQSMSGQHVGYTNVPVERTRTARRYRNTYCCKRCGHVWIGNIKTSR